MNQNLTLGAITFLVWSTLSTWYYVCQIKGLCIEAASAEVVVKPKPKPAPKPAVQPAAAEVKNDEPKPLPVISIQEEKIYFRINTADFVDSNFVDTFVNNVVTETADRQIQIDVIGYTCDLGRTEYNLQLSRERAEKMKSAFVAQGLRSEDISIKAGGEISPSDNPTDSERQKNRKVTINIKSTDS